MDDAARLGAHRAATSDRKVARLDERTRSGATLVFIGLLIAGMATPNVIAWILSGRPQPLSTILVVVGLVVAVTGAVLAVRGGRALAAAGTVAQTPERAAPDAPQDSVAEEWRPKSLYADPTLWLPPATEPVEGDNGVPPSRPVAS